MDSKNEDDENKEIAIEASMSRAPDSKGAYAAGFVRDFMQGDLVVIKRVDEDRGEVEDIVFIRDGQVSVYDTAEEMATALRSLTTKQGLSELLKPAYIPGILALALIAGWVFLVTTTGPAESLRFIENSLGIVLGFYFGTRR